MSAFTPGQRVNVKLDGGKLGTILPTSHGTTLFVDVDNVGEVCIPADWVELVTPAYPWTEIGTLVQIDGGCVYRLEIPTGRPQMWLDIVENYPVDWATDIAPYNPRRLVPEQPARPMLQTGVNSTCRTWLPIEGTDRYLERRGRDSGTRAQIETTYGPVTEVDGPAVTT